MTATVADTPTFITPVTEDEVKSTKKKTTRVTINSKKAMLNELGISEAGSQVVAMLNSKGKTPAPRHTKYRAIAEQLAADPGQWYKIATHSKKPAIYALSSNIRKSTNSQVWKVPGVKFEAQFIDLNQVTWPVDSEDLKNPYVLYARAVKTGKKVS